MGGFLFPLGILGESPFPLLLFKPGSVEYLALPVSWLLPCAPSEDGKGWLCLAQAVTAVCDVV